MLVFYRGWSNERPARRRCCLLSSLISSQLFRGRVFLQWCLLFGCWIISVDANYYAEAGEADKASETSAGTQTSWQSSVAQTSWQASVARIFCQQSVAEISKARPTAQGS